MTDLRELGDWQCYHCNTPVFYSLGAHVDYVMCPRCVKTILKLDKKSLPITRKTPVVAIYHEGAD